MINARCVIDVNRNKTLQVWVPVFISERLKFKPNPINTKLELGSNSKVHCRADARSPPVIRWKKEGAYDFPSHVVDVDGTLFFNGVRYSDEGNYTCIAQTETEKINVTISIEVVGKILSLCLFCGQD